MASSASSWSSNPSSSGRDDERACSAGDISATTPVSANMNSAIATTTPGSGATSVTNSGMNDVSSSSKSVMNTPTKKKKCCEISIFWDYESVPLPSGCSAAAVSKAIVATVSTHGRIVDRRLYYNLERLLNQQNNSQECSSLDSCGFDLVHTPTRHGKETIDKKLIADVLTFSWDATVRSCSNNNNNSNTSNGSDDDDENNNSKPYVVLLTSDGDYAYTLSKLRDRGVQTIVISSSSSGHHHHGNNSNNNNNNNNSSSVLMDVADIALSLEGDVLQLPVTPRSSSLQQSLQQQNNGVNNSTGKSAGDYTNTTTTNTTMDASLMEIFVTAFCRLIDQHKNNNREEDGDWQNYAQLSELLQRVIRQKKPPSTTSDDIKEWTKQIRAKSVQLGLVQIGRRVLLPHAISNNGNKRSIQASTAKNYDKSKLSLEMYVALLPQGQAVARGRQASVVVGSSGSGSGNSSGNSLVVSSSSSSPGGEMGGNNTTTLSSPKAEMEVLIVELCRVVQQKVANSNANNNGSNHHANRNPHHHFDSWVDLGGVLARLQTIIRQRAKNNSSSKKMKDYDVKEKARSVRELAATRGLIAIGKRRLESGCGEEREIIALSKNTRHLTLSGESYVCLLPKGEMRLAEPEPEPEAAPVTERRLVVHTTTNATTPTSASSSSLRTSGTSYLEMAAKASPANGTPLSSSSSPSPISSPSSSSFDLSLALCRIIHERANGPAATHHGWVDLGETISQLQQIMRGNNLYSTDDIKDKARSIRLEAGKRGLLESGRRVLTDSYVSGGGYNNDNEDKAIVPLSKDTKHQYHHLKLGEYYLRLLDKGEKLVISNQGNSGSLALTPSSYSSRPSPSPGQQQGTTDFMVSLVKAVQQFSSDKDGWAGLGSALGQLQTAIRKSSNNRNNPDEIKELSRSLREQAVDKCLIEMGRRRLDATGLGGAREIVVCNESRPTDPSLSSESYVRLLFKGEVLLQKGIISSPSSMVSPSSFSINSEAQSSSSPAAVPMSSTLVFVRNLPSTTQVRDLVRFLEVEFSATVTRARIRKAPHSTMCAHIEVLREAEAALLIEQSKNQTDGGEGIYFNNRKIMIFPETIKSSLDVVGDEAMYYEKDMTPMSSTSLAFVDTGTSLTLDETTETDVMSEFAAEWAGKNTCIVLCRNFPRVTHVLDLVRFLQNTFPVTVCRALMEVAGAMSSAYVELLHVSEANMLIDEAKKTPGSNAMVFQNRPISVFPSYSTAALDAKGDETMYYEAGGPTFQTDSFNDAAGADHQLMQPGSSIVSVDTMDTSADVASFCLVLLSLEDKQGLDPSSWINGANVGVPFRSLLPREYVQTASKDEMSARFKSARTKAVEGGLIEVGRRRLEQGDIVTVPLSIFGRNPTELNFTLDVFFRLLSTGHTLALETKASLLPAKKEIGHEESLYTKHIFMNNLPLSTSSQQLYEFLHANFSCVVNGIALQQNNWKGESVQCAHVELENTTGAAEILRAAKTPPGLIFCGRFVYTVADSSPEQTTATQTDAESSLMTAQIDAESSLIISSFPSLDLGGSQSF